MIAGRRNDFFSKIPTILESHHFYLIFLFVIFYFPLLTGMNHMWEDVVKQHYPNLICTMNSLLHGHFLFWTPHVYAGMPYLADLQTAIFYPPHWLLFLTASIPVSKGILLTWFITGHLLLFGYGVYHLVRSFDCSRSVSTYSAIALMFCGFSSLHIHHPNAIYVISWFPWAFLFLKKYFEGNRIKHLGMASLLFGISILGGYSQYTAFCLIILLFFTISFAWWNRRKGLQSCAATGFGFLIFLLLSFGLAMIQLLPTIELYLQSVRTRMSWSESVIGSLSPDSLLTLLSPGFFGGVTGIDPISYWKTSAFFLFWETAIFIGILPLIILAIGFAGLYRNKHFVFFFLLGIFGLAMAMGKNLPFYLLLFKLPGFSQFRIPGRFSFIFSFGFILASGISLNYLESKKRPDSGIPKNGILPGVLLSVIMILALISAAIFIKVPGNHKSASLQSLVQALVSILLSWFLIILLYKLKAKLAVNSAIIFFVFFELFFFAHRFSLGPMSEIQTYPPRGIFTRLKSQSNLEPFRLYFRNRPASGEENRMILPENLGNVYQIDTINGYNQLMLSRFYYFFSEVDKIKALRLLNTKYTVSVSGRSIKKSLVPGSCSRFGLRSQITWVKDGRQALQHVKKKSFDPDIQAIVEGSPTLKMDKSIPPSSLGSIKILSRLPHCIALNIQTSSNSLLFASEIWYPGWKARLDNQEFPILRTNYLFRGIEIPAGNHHLTLTYTSVPFQWGKWISLFFLILVTLFICQPYRFSLKKRDKNNRQ